MNKYQFARLVKNTVATMIRGGAFLGVVVYGFSLISDLSVPTGPVSVVLYVCTVLVVCVELATAGTR